jgi:glycerophosphoryl diester phosphodiesterase
VRVSFFLFTCLLMAQAGADEARIQLPARGLCAHRGASATHPENTLAAFREAGRLGAHMIEFDVYLTKDKAPVIMHDPTVNRTTNGKGEIAEMTLAEIKDLDAGSWKSPEFKGERVPKLEEALGVMPLNVWLNIHLKEGKEAGEKVAQAVLKANRLHQAFLACGVEAAQAAHAVAPTLKICNMERQGPADAYVAKTIEVKAEFIQLAGPLDEQLTKRCDLLKAHGIHINYFGVEKPEGVRELSAAGVDFPLVNDVSGLMKVAGEFGIRPVTAVYQK